MRRVTLVYGNRPEPLAANVMRCLRDTGNYEVDLLYYERLASSVSLPLPTEFEGIRSSSVARPVGNGTLGKVMNRAVVLAKLARRIKAAKPHVVHAWNFDMLLAARAGTVGMREARIVFTLQDTTGWMVSPLWRPIQRWAYAGADVVFVTSQGFEHEFLRKFQLIESGKRVEFVPNVPTAQEFANFKPRSVGPELNVGCIGLLRGREGLETLVEATRFARDRGAKVSLLFAGKGPEQSFVERMAQQYPFVAFLGPYSHDRDIRDIYARVDVLYAIYDRSYDKRIHLAYRLCEAINCGLPIIVARDTHMEEVVRAYDVGVAAEIGNVEELTARLVELWSSSDMRRRFTENCEKARPEFVFEKYEGAIREAYDRLWG